MQWLSWVSDLHQSEPWIKKHEIRNRVWEWRVLKNNRWWRHCRRRRRWSEEEDRRAFRPRSLPLSWPSSLVLLGFTSPAGLSLSLSIFSSLCVFFIKISLLTQFGSHFCWKHIAALSRFVNLQFDSSEFLLFVFELWSEISNLTDSVFYFCFFGSG